MFTDTAMFTDTTKPALPLRNPLLLKLLAIIGVGTVVLFLFLDNLTRHTEDQMSFIESQYQQQMLDYGAEAERIYYQEGEQRLQHWITNLQKQEDTWAAIVNPDLIPLAGTHIDEGYLQRFALGRDVRWKIHLYFTTNPTIEVPFSTGEARFIMQLPQRMRPGAYLPYMALVLQIALPLLILCLMAYIIYRHVMAPLQRLEQATRRFSQGQLDVRASSNLGNRNDELTVLAKTFDHMAERTSELITTQRQMLSDLSHELRTPLARMDMAVDGLEAGFDRKQAVTRLRHETSTMRSLVEDVLTLAWLSNENPRLQQDDFDLTELLEVICEDARFEFPQHLLTTQLPDEAPLYNSSQRALGQAVENIIRNALSHTPPGLRVELSLRPTDDHYQIQVRDQGPGVPATYLTDIFRPFFQLDKSRTNTSDSGHPPYADQHRGRGGFGLGLALAKRQIEAAGGAIVAQNSKVADSQNTTPEPLIPHGLEITITLPLKGSNTSEHPAKSSSDRADH